jgi:hypothetical protein
VLLHMDGNPTNQDSKEDALSLGLDEKEDAPNEH